MKRCERCGKETPTILLSYYSRDRLCPACHDDERRAACFYDSERPQAVGAGRDRNLPGIAGAGKDGINFHR